MPVSKPNQFTPVRTTFLPLASTISLFFVDSGPSAPAPVALAPAAEVVVADWPSVLFTAKAVTVPPTAAAATTAAAIPKRRRCERGARLVSVVGALFWSMGEFIR
ncbi:hypothetical protein SANTM175S_07504 [Streptomyces antimycoticus]